MRILHTSDWHIGRTFHQHSTLEALREVFDGVCDIVRAQRVDVVVAAGDIYDSSMPSADAVDLFNEILTNLRDAGATLVLSAGNHDSPTRLGTLKGFAATGGLHLITSPDQVTEPVTLGDEHGDVHFYGLPFLEPSRLRQVWDGEFRTQRDVVSYAMDLVRADATERGGRSVVLAHTFVAGAEGESCDSERDIVSSSLDVGGIDRVPVPVFDGVTYAALGHIHGRATLADHVRYSGAPLHYSFSEADKPRGGWLVDLRAEGLGQVEWVDFPVPRPLRTVTGLIEELLGSEEFGAWEGHWIRAVLTDRVRPVDAMRRLQARFPHCSLLEFRPGEVADDAGPGYAEMVRGRSDEEIVDAFLVRVRNGVGATETEREVIRDVIAGHADDKVRA